MAQIYSILTCLENILTLVQLKPKTSYIMGFIIYIAGLVLSVLAVLDILKKPISGMGKIITAVLVLLTSWVGLAVYYLYAKDHLTEWFK